MASRQRMVCAAALAAGRLEYLERLLIGTADLCGAGRLLTRSKKIEEGHIPLARCTADMSHTSSSERNPARISFVRTEGLTPCSRAVSMGSALQVVEGRESDQVSRAIRSDQTNKHNQKIVCP